VPALSPGQNDDVTFPAGNGVNCVQRDTITINSLTIDKAYRGTLFVATLNVACGGTATSTIAGGTILGDQLHVQPGSQAFSWKGGTLSADLYVDANARLTILPLYWFSVNGKFAFGVLT
jgi:hypothetical protein